MTCEKCCIYSRIDPDTDLIACMFYRSEEDEEKEG
jgi:hypothetical protein